MSIRYRAADGTETIVSGLTPGGDIEAGTVMTRTGQVSVTGPSSFNSTFDTIITFSEPLPDANYIVDISSNGADLSFTVLLKTASGFRLRTGLSSNDGAGKTATVTYTATKTYTVQHAVQNAEDIANIKAVIPSTASSTNQLTPKKYVDDADTALDERVSDLEDLVPTGADVTNQLTTKSYVDDAIQNVEIDVDDALDSDSENPVQNKVVKAAIDTKQDKVFIGTLAEWNALTPTEANKYQLVNLIDDGETGREQNYLTTEQKTGEKWIDGKDIYRISFIQNNPYTTTKPSTNAEIIVRTYLTSCNIDKIIKWDAIATWSGSGTNTPTYYFPTDVTVSTDLSGAVSGTTATVNNGNYTRQYYTIGDKTVTFAKNGRYYSYGIQTYNTIYYTKK